MGKISELYYKFVQEESLDKRIAIYAEIEAKARRIDKAGTVRRRMTAVVGSLIDVLLAALAVVVNVEPPLPAFLSNVVAFLKPILWSGRGAIIVACLTACPIWFAIIFAILGSYLPPCERKAYTADANGLKELAKDSDEFKHVWFSMWDSWERDGYISFLLFVSSLVWDYILITGPGKWLYINYIADNDESGWLVFTFVIGLIGLWILWRGAKLAFEKLFQLIVGNVARHKYFDIAIYFDQEWAKHDPVEKARREEEAQRKAYEERKQERNAYRLKQLEREGWKFVPNGHGGYKAVSPGSTPSSSSSDGCGAYGYPEELGPTWLPPDGYSKDM